MSEQFCTVGGVELCHETFGEAANPTILLIMGLGTQMVAWHGDFCRELAGHGFHVVRFDNRDIGRSSRIDGPVPTLGQLLRRSKASASYTLDDMAADTIGLLDHLGVERAHLVGASMGGMIAQTVTALHPERVASLVSIMSTTGRLWVGQPAARVMPVLFKQAPHDREGYVRHVVRTFDIVGSPELREPDELRDVAAAMYDRGIDNAGPARQLAAIIASGDRTRRLRAIHVPTLVIHGTRDRLVRPSGGRATARAIRGAKLKMVEGMGHDLPRKAWPQIIEGIVETAARAGAPAVAAA